MKGFTRGHVDPFDLRFRAAGAHPLPAAFETLTWPNADLG